MLSCFFFDDTATTEIYTLSLHDALPISYAGGRAHRGLEGKPAAKGRADQRRIMQVERSEEHTSELQSRFDLVCRLLLEKKKRVEQVCVDEPRVVRLVRVTACLDAGRAQR